MTVVENETVVANGPGVNDAEVADPTTVSVESVDGLARSTSGCDPSTGSSPAVTDS